MKASMKSKLEALVKRIDVLNTELSHEDVTKDMERYKKISKEHSDITPIVEIYKKFQKITLDITDAKELLNDPEMKVFAQEEIEEGEASIEEVETELLKLLIPKDDDDEKNENLVIFSDNQFYNNWNKSNKKSQIINYLLPTEDLEDLNLIKSKSSIIENYDFKEIIQKYSLDDYIITIIFKNLST